jgi:hypothetical protein
VLKAVGFITEKLRAVLSHSGAGGGMDRGAGGERGMMNDRQGDNKRPRGPDYDDRRRGGPGGRQLFAAVCSCARMCNCVKVSCCVKLLLYGHSCSSASQNKSQQVLSPAARSTVANMLAADYTHAHCPVAGMPPGGPGGPPPDRYGPPPGAPRAEPPPLVALPHTTYPTQTVCCLYVCRHASWGTPT